MLRFLESLQFVLFIFFTAAYAYQFVYLAVGLFGKGKQVRQDANLHRYAAIISARNEEGVIGDLVKSLKEQNYPAQLLDVYVVADNCTDSTASVARKAGATVFERFNKVQVGKGYAMDWLFKRIFADKGEQTYDAFLVFDADNLVDPNFVREMNKMFDTGEYAALTSYRNSKNFCDNWISAGYALWFLREARFLNRPRTQLGVNCAVSGTGFLIAGDVIREDGGWPYHLLTEDIEFSIACAVRGRKIGYCGTAVVYDEQPVQFRQEQGLLPGGRQVYGTGASRLHPRRQARRILLRYADDGCALQPGDDRRPWTGVVRLPEQPVAAGVHYIPCAAHAGPDYPDHASRRVVQSVPVRCIYHVC